MLELERAELFRLVVLVQLVQTVALVLLIICVDHTNRNRRAIAVNIVVLR